MTLTNLSKFPPSGYLYSENINGKLWKATPEMALLGLDTVARALQIARIQNPLAGLDPSYDACVESIKLFTCARLNYNPLYCGEDAPPEVLLVASNGSVPVKRKRGCASCGKRR